MATNKKRIIVTPASDAQLEQIKADAQAIGVSVSAWLLTGRGYGVLPRGGDRRPAIKPVSRKQKQSNGDKL